MKVNRTKIVLFYDNHSQLQIQRASIDPMLRLNRMTDYAILVLGVLHGRPDVLLSSAQIGPAFFS